MTLFRCEVITAGGDVEHVQLEAPTQQAAVAQLIAEGQTPINIRFGVPGLLERFNQPIHFKSGFGVADQSLLLTQLAALVRAGLPVDRSLDLLVDQSAKRRQRASLRRVVKNVRAGETLSIALDNEAIFPAWTIGVLRSTEHGGGLGEALASLAQRLSDLTRTRRELASALTYPAAVLAATIVALGLVLLVVIPQFKPVFAGQEDKLPALTRIVLWLSDHAALWLPVTLAGILLPPALFFVLRGRLSKALQQKLIKLPGLHLREQYLAAQFSGLLATLLGNGLTLVRTLPLIAAGLPSRRWRAHLRRVEQHVREGQALSVALRAEAILPLTVLRLLEVGERTGQLGHAAFEAGRIIDEAARARLQRAISLANPIAIVSLGAMVALLVSGVMLGIFSIGDLAS